MTTHQTFKRFLYYRYCVLLIAFLAMTAAVVADEIAKPNAYDPLFVSETDATETLDLTVKDQTRKREIPLRIYLPPQATSKTISDYAADAVVAQGVIIFSHGLGGARTGSPFLGRHWSRRGYVAVFLQHQGSDEAVWKDVPLGERMEAMRRNASARNALDRMQDVSTVLDQLAVWNTERGHPLFAWLKLNAVGMSGHSFGAQTTQAVAGQRSILGTPWRETSRIKAALPMSPNVPAGIAPEQAFGKVTTPWLLMTGTHDGSFINNTTPADRRRVYAALPSGDKYELVLDRAEHSVFTETRLPSETEPRNPRHHAAILAISTAFWDAYLKNDPAAKTWLQSAAVRSVLEPNDLWQFK